MKSTAPLNRLQQELGYTFKDPALLVRMLAALLPLGGTDELAREARRTVDAIVAALPDPGMRARFLGAEAIAPIAAS